MSENHLLRTTYDLQLKIDAHQHFWKFDPVRDSWITDEMSAIKRDFLPKDLHPVLQENSIDGCVAVQADQSETETNFLLSLADKNDFIKGVVGWIDLQADNIVERLKYYSQYKKLKGFRHVLQSERNRSLMLEQNFKRGIAALNKFNFTYDILIHQDQLQFIPEFVSEFPEQKFVIDHLAKPGIKNKKINKWKTGLSALGKYENVYCKLSGMVTEADLNRWKKEDFKPYLDSVVEVFGGKRIMFGSDWPVCLLAASYKQVVDVMNNYFSTFTYDEQADVFGRNAIEFYNLN